MKKLLILLCFFNWACVQSGSCDELVQRVENKGIRIELAEIASSTAISKAEYFKMDNETFVIIHFKGKRQSKPYVFCSVSESLWKSFIDKGSSSSWGKSFHKFIEPQKCDCN